MKTRLICLITAFLWFFSAFSQETDIIDSLDQTPQQQFEYITQNLDLSSISTGLLADKCWPLVPYLNYDGQHLADSNKASAFIFAKMYATLSSMPIDSTYKLPPPDSYTDTLKHIPEGTVYMGGLHYEYQRIKPFALDSNLLTSDSTQLFDVSNPSESPYQQKEVFLVTPMRLKTRSLSTNFVFSQGLFYSNTSKSIDSIYVDFDDGRDSVKIWTDSTYMVLYDTSGFKTITTIIYYDDQTIYTSHAQLQVIDELGGTRGYDFDLDSLIVNTETVLATTPYDPGNDDEYGGAYVTTLLACGHEKLVKPLIWVEGFNPPLLTNLNPKYNLDPKYAEDILNDQFINGKHLLKYCEEEGYDLVYVDFFDGGDWIQKNAYVVQTIIDTVNARKAKNGSTEKNVVIGESMGGLIAKYALRDMELNNEDHETKTYMSLDSPHKGANIPLCAQYASKHIPYIKIFNTELWEYLYIPNPVDNGNNDTIGFDLRLGEQLLETHAAQQMLIYQAPDNFHNQTGTDLYASEYVDFYTEYDSLGDLQYCETLMSSNGSQYGSGGEQEFSPGDELIKFHFNNSDIYGYWLQNMNLEFNTLDEATLSAATMFGMAQVVTLGSIVTQGFINFRLNALPNYSSSKERIYKGHFSCHIGGIPITWTHKVVKVKEVYPLDSSPGGFFDIPITVSLDTMPFLQQAVAWENVKIKNTFNYIPTFSALDLPSSFITNPYSDLSNLNTTNTNSSASRTVLNDTIYGYNNFYNDNTDLNNSLHIHFYQNNAEWFLFHLIGNNGINDNTTWTSGSFNFGEGNIGSTDNYTNTDHRRTTSKIDNLDEISGTGQVYINKSNRIGDINNDNGPYTVVGSSSDPTNFIVNLKRKCSEVSEGLIVHSGGLLYIGEGENQTGELHLLEGTSLTIDNGGDLYIQPNSKIVVHPGAKLILKDGADVHNQGTIELLGEHDGINWNSSELEYHSGVYLQMEHNDAEIHFNGGDLKLKQNADFVMYHATGPSGHLRFSAWGTHIYGESGSKITLSGDVDYDPIIYIDENADFWNNTPDDLDFISLSTGTVVMDENSRFVATQRLTCSQINFDAVSATDNRGIITFEKSNFSGCEFNDVRLEAWQIYDPDAHLLITNSEVNNHDHISGDYPSILVNGKSYSVFNTTFEPTSDFATLRSKMLTGNPTVSSCTFDADGQTDAKIIDDSDVLLLVKSSDFLNSDWGVIKRNGELGLRCNSFDYVDVGIKMLENTRLYAANFDGNYGYNTFTNIDDYSIQFHHANDAILKEGYNDFGVGSSSSDYFAGSMNFFFPTPLSPVLNAEHNTWEGAATSPAQSKYNLYHDDAQQSITVTNSNAESQTSCGTYDEGGGVVIGGGINTADNGVELPVLGFEFHEDNTQKRLDHLIADAMRLSEVYDTTSGNNSDAIELFHGIMTYDYSGYDQDTIDMVNIALNFTYYQMKYTLYNAFEQQQITEADNSESFDPDVAKFAAAINVRSDLVSRNGNDHLIFYHEMEKAYFFRLLGHYDMAIDILENAEYCGLDSTEQHYLNSLKFDISEENAQRDYGYRAALIDTVFTDSSGYSTPEGSGQTPYLFESTINGLNDVSFYAGCGGKHPLDVTEDNDITIDIYPNPNNGSFRISYYLPEESTGFVQVSGIDGKQIRTFPCKEGSWEENVTLRNCESGIYLYSYFVDGIKMKTGKIVIY